MLENEFEFYKSRQSELVEKYEGKFLAVVGEEIVGVFDTELDAYETTKQTHSLSRDISDPALPWLGSSDTNSGH